MFLFAPVSKVFLLFHGLLFVYSSWTIDVTNMVHPFLQLPHSVWGLGLICIAILRCIAIERALGTKMFVHFFMLSILASFVLLIPLALNNYLPANLQYILESWLYYKSRPRSLYLLVRGWYKFSWISFLVSMLFYSTRYFSSAHDKILNISLIVALWTAGFDKMHFGMPLHSSVAFGYLLHLVLYYTRALKRPNLASIFNSNQNSYYIYVQKFFGTWPDPSWFHGSSLAKSDNTSPSVESIMSMGFSMDQATRALSENGHDVDRAINSLLDQE
jgi:hypothetical protein